MGGRLHLLVSFFGIRSYCLLSVGNKIRNVLIAYFTSVLLCFNYLALIDAFMELGHDVDVLSQVDSLLQTKL